MTNFPRDNLNVHDYGLLMEQGAAIIRLRLDVQDRPIELGDFVSTFTSLAAEFERYKRDQKPEIASESTLFVKGISRGSIVAEIVSVIPTAIPSTILLMENANTVRDFMGFYGNRLLSLIGSGARLENSSKSELKRFNDQVAAIANAPGSTLEMASFSQIDGDLRQDVVFKFKSSDAIQIQENTSAQIREIEHKEYELIRRVSMVFQRTDTQSANPGKKSGDLVVIESISPKRLGLIYASDLTEQAIKNEIREADDNVYKKVFIVDAFVEMMNGKPFAYRITDLHQVLTLDED